MHFCLNCLGVDLLLYFVLHQLKVKTVRTSVGTLLENTRLGKTRRFLHGRVLARNYSRRKIANSTRSDSKVEFRVMPGYTRPGTIGSFAKKNCQSDVHQFLHEKKLN